LPHRFDGRIGRPDHGDQYDRDAGVDLAELPQDVQAGLVGQAQVEENDVWPNGGDAFETLGARVGDLDAVCGGGEHVAHLVGEQVRVVIDEEQAGHATPSQAWLHLDIRPSVYESVTKRSVEPFCILFGPAVVGAEPSRLASLLARFA
jgi:hypothetical protein